MCYNPCVAPLPKIKYLFFLLPIFVDQLISTPKIITFLSTPIPGYEKPPRLSNPRLYREYLYLLISAFLVKLTASNKQFSSVGSLLVVLPFLFIL